MRGRTRSTGVEIDQGSPSSLGGLLDADARLERVASGFGFTEGPVWDPRQDALLFSDLEHDVRRRFREGEGVSVVAEGTERANGMTFDRDGSLIVCEHVSSSLVRIDRAGTRTLLATHFEGRELNSPNDVVVRSDGVLYFTDPPYGRSNDSHGTIRPQQLDFQAVFRLLPAAPEPEPLARDFAKPNGLCFSLDETALYVADTERMHVRSFGFAPDGTLTGGAVFVELPEDAPGFPDGMRLDEHGNLWTTGPGGIWVVDPAGRVLGRIRLPEIAANLAWGGPELRELFVTATTSLYRIRTRIAGAPLPHVKHVSGP